MAIINTTTPGDTSPPNDSTGRGAGSPRQGTGLAARARRIWRAAGVPVWGMVGIFAALALFTQDQAAASAAFTADSFFGILPFILASVAIAAALKASGADNFVAKAFAARPAIAVVTASIFGALSPFCSCGVIPLVAGMLAAGVPIAPVLAFCIASPVMDPEMFILTAAGLGLDFAVVKTFSAMGMGLFAGFVALGLDRAGLLTNALKPIAQPRCCGGAGSDAAPATNWRFWREAERRDAFMEASVGNFVFLGRWLLFAFLLESLMVTYVPGELVATWLGRGNDYALPLAVALGVPAYMNGYAGIPLVRGLIELGMAAPTGLAFMLAGGFTSIPAAMAFYSIARAKLFALYLGVGITGALAAAALWQVFQGG